jgi:SAM-dependent methyltransferase
MGLDIRTAEFLLHCKNSGVNFVNSCTLGRQTVMLLPSERKKIYQWTGVQLKGCEFADIFLEYLGAAPPHSMDASQYEGADIIHNLNEKVPKHLENNFDCLIDGGTLEHIFEFTNALRSCLSMVRPGGHLIICNMANNHMGHGFYQFSPELFFSAFTPDNGCRLQSIFLNDGGTWYKPLDPNIVGCRLESRTVGCTTVFVCVQRISDNPPLTAPPHQSDYRFNNLNSSETSKVNTIVHKQSMRQKIGAVFPSVKKQLKRWREFKQTKLYGILPFYEECDGRWSRFKGNYYRSINNRANFSKIGHRLPPAW